MRSFTTTLVFIFSLIIFSSCSHVVSGDKLSESDIYYLKELGLLSDNETVILFETHAGSINSFEKNGSFFTDKRIASYWIDNDDSTNTEINFALYEHIDTITTQDYTNEWDLASYLIVHVRGGGKFNVFIGANKTDTWLFFNKAIDEWTKHKK